MFAVELEHGQFYHEGEMIFLPQGLLFCFGGAN